MSPDGLLQRQNGMNIDSGSYVTYAGRSELERAVMEQNKPLVMANRFVEVHMA